MAAGTRSRLACAMNIVLLSSLLPLSHETQTWLVESGYHTACTNIENYTACPGSTTGPCTDNKARSLVLARTVGRSRVLTQSPTVLVDLAVRSG